MFLNALIAKNRAFVEAAVTLHQSGAVPANSYLLDLDTMRANAAALASTAQGLGLTVYAMTKQFGRNPPALDAIRAGGIDRFVAVDMACARPIHRSGHRLGHLGHLSQVPRGEAREGARMRPEIWTVFNAGKAAEAADAAASIGHVQGLVARIFAQGDRFYDGHEGGFAAEEIERVADLLDERPGGRFAGITSFPALLFDEATGAVTPTPNLRTLEATARRLAATGRKDLVVNTPGTNSAAVMQVLAEAGATQVEPGHALTGTTPLHALRDLPENPAMLYLSEVSHIHQGTPFSFGGGLYVDPVFRDYPVKVLVGGDADAALRQAVPATIPAPAMIDYYGKLHPEAGQTVRVGDTVIYGFRAQAFVRRAYIVPVEGIHSGEPKVRGIWTPEGREAAFT